MFGHVILGLLRDCRLRHGYEIMTECRARSGSPVSIGNIYRELARLAGQGLVQTAINPPDADARRIPYHITEKGRLAFDQWLQAPSSQDDVAHWLLFVDRVPEEIRVRLLDRWQEELWMRGKELARAREDALAKRGRQPPEHYNPLAPLLSRRMKQVAAELEDLGGRGRSLLGCGQDRQREREKEIDQVLHRRCSSQAVSKARGGA